MLTSPIFFVWVVWLLGIGVVAILRARSVARENAHRRAREAARDAARAERESVRDAECRERRVRPAAAPLPAPVAVLAAVPVPPSRADMIAVGRIIPLGSEALAFAADDVAWATR